MKVTISGYGKMGKEIEKIIVKRGHTIFVKCDSTEELNSLQSGNSICIDFTIPSAFKNNYKLIADKFDGAIVGTTGWYDIIDEVKNYFKSKNKKLIYGTNFSVGMNILFNITEYAGNLLSGFGYDPYIMELHHKEKKDAPSGTAITLNKILNKNYKKEIPVSSVRSGYIKGIHDIGFESEVDKINIRHEAYSREGFALGAVLAAEWIDNVNGCVEFRELFKTMINEQ
jgi:4-hydroxy-tetrahydrodipicolinate reductase